jgi:hypothetical protein
MLSYHLYITHFEQLLERDQPLQAEVFTRCRAIHAALAAGVPNDRGVYRHLARSVLAAGGGAVAGVSSASVAAGLTDLTAAERQELLHCYEVVHINDARTYHLSADQMRRLWAPQRDVQEFLEWVVPPRFFSMTDRELQPEGVHRWRYNDAAVKRGLLATLRTPTQALGHPFFAPYVAAAAALGGGGGGGGGGSDGAGGGGAAAMPAPVSAAAAVTAASSPPVALYTHPLTVTAGGGGGGGGAHSAVSGGAVASAPSSLLTPAPSLVTGMPVGLTSPARGGAGGSGMTLPLTLPAAATGGGSGGGFVFGAGADTARAGGTSSGAKAAAAGVPHGAAHHGHHGGTGGYGR